MSGSVIVLDRDINGTPVDDSVFIGGNHCLLEEISLNGNKRDNLRVARIINDVEALGAKVDADLAKTHQYPGM